MQLNLFELPARELNKGNKKVLQRKSATATTTATSKLDGRHEESSTITTTAAAKQQQSNSSHVPSASATPTVPLVSKFESRHEKVTTTTPQQPNSRGLSTSPSKTATTMLLPVKSESRNEESSKQSHSTEMLLDETKSKVSTATRTTNLVLSSQPPLPPKNNCSIS